MSNLNKHINSDNKLLVNYQQKEAEYLRQNAQIYLPQITNPKEVSVHGIECGKVIDAFCYEWESCTGIALTMKMEQNIIPERKFRYDFAILCEKNIICVVDISTHHGPNEWENDKEKDDLANEDHPDIKIFQTVNCYPDERCEVTHYIPIAKTTKVSDLGNWNIAAELTECMKRYFQMNYINTFEIANRTVEILNLPYFGKGYIPREAIAIYEKRNNSYEHLKLTEDMATEEYKDINSNIKKEMLEHIAKAKELMMMIEKEKPINKSVKEELIEIINNFDYSKPKFNDPFYKAMCKIRNKNEICHALCSLIESKNQFHADAILMMIFGITKAKTRELKGWITENPEKISKIISLDGIKTTESQLERLEQLFLNNKFGFKLLQKDILVSLYPFFEDNIIKNWDNICINVKKIRDRDISLIKDFNSALAAAQKIYMGRKVPPSLVSKYKKNTLSNWNKIVKIYAF